MDFSFRGIEYPADAADGRKLASVKEKINVDFSAGSTLASLPFVSGLFIVAACALLVTLISGLVPLRGCCTGVSTDDVARQRVKRVTQSPGGNATVALV